MKIAYFHCFAGAAGNMILGALLDAGLSLEKLQADLEKLPFKGFRLEMGRVSKHGIYGTKLKVIVEDNKTHRRLKDIKAIISGSALPEAIREKSIRIFTRLAEAEAKVHGITADEIIFHEVGATDAIVDVVGAAIGLWRLGIEEAYASPVNVGSGLAQSAHGVIPVPGPATMELLQGVPVYSQGVEKELTTPTGAAILTTCCSAFGDIPPMRVIVSGYGAGDHDLAIPNLLRVTIGEKLSGNSPAAGAMTEGGYHQAPALMLEANIDDMNPEFYDYLISELLEAGAMDVFLQTIQMKKNRPAVTLCVLIGPEDLDKFGKRIFAETTTLGFRVYPVTKYMLPYETIALKTSLGHARVKIVRRQGKICNVAPEYEDCRKLARENKIPLKEVYDRIKCETHLLCQYK
ncbi:MAG: nickel pincer cofactor biosynthesis protein LarC [Syntrophales bacterium]|nr:nickel pincer cofactor biosynthesis protein LarC [Syntrophales bacterium]